MRPGEVIVGPGEVTVFADPEVSLTVSNLGDRPIQVGSHFHFAEANRSLEFDRDAAWGMRLAIPAGTSVRFEPGINRQVELVRLVGDRVVLGLRRLVGGALDHPGGPGA